MSETPKLTALLALRRVTCVKPTRTVEVLTDASPGIEPVYSETYIRRVVYPADCVRSPISNAVEPETAHE